jgi:ferredoxin
MRINAVKLIFFSPTGTTKKTLRAIARGIGAERVEEVNLTPPEAKDHEFPPLRADELALIGAPVYGGRIPLVAVERLRQVRGQGTPAALVVLYGNREFEDALLELRDLAIEQGFRPLAGGAFIGEHSYSTAAIPLSMGRPDATDLQKASEFGAQIAAKLVGLSAPEEIGVLDVPGNLPYRERRPPSGIAPITDELLCTKSGDCARACPTAAITVAETVTTDVQGCILCCACVRACLTNARTLDHPRTQQSRRWLSANCAQRKEPRTFV